jgi:hypothetical protein
LEIGVDEVLDIPAQIAVPFLFNDDPLDLLKLALSKGNRLSDVWFTRNRWWHFYSPVITVITLT